jgi:predicted transcriptional regulator
MGERVLRQEEAEELLVNLLKEAGRPLTTREVQGETQKRLVRCPDATVVLLNRLRIKGCIKGEMNKERKGWIWWV